MSAREVLRRRCIYFACGNRREDGDGSGYWWDKYGACCQEHAELHYGEEAME